MRVTVDGKTREMKEGKVQYQIIGDSIIFNSKTAAYSRCLYLGVSRNQVLTIYPMKKTQKLIHILRKHNQL